MTELIIVAIISAVVSLIVALLTTTLRNRADLLKVQKEQEHGFTKALFDRRVEYYPLLYQLLSGYGKDIRRGKQNLENLSTFKQKVDEWNNQHSIFFTKSTGRYSSRFRTYLDLILNNHSSDLSSEEWEHIRKLLNFFEDSLKEEIGIFSTKPVGPIEKYKEATELVEGLIEQEKEKLRSLSPSAPNKSLNRARN